MELLIIAVVGLLVIAACNQLAPRVGLASPLILLGLGLGIGFLPWVHAVEINPELILQGVLPPLLFATAVSMPVMDFRRELRSVSGLAVGLVLICAVLLGLVIHAIIPGVPLPWAVALGAVLSPTDAVAVTIARGVGVNHRIITVLEGEGLFNDATALVLLSSAVAAGLDTNGGALRPGSLATGFIVALAVAVIVGWTVGEVTVRIRAKITDPAADTVISFTIPFLAAIPAEHLHGSGLVAAVMAGLVVSHHGPGLLPPANRRTAHENWRTVELVLEGAIFLVMGLQAAGIVDTLQHDPNTPGVGRAVALAVLVGGLTLVIRAVFVAVLLVWLRWVRRSNRRRLATGADRIIRFEERLAHACDVDEELLAARDLTQQEWQQAVARWHARLDRGRRRHERASNDMAYFVAATLGWREGTVIVWAGMRGAVTLAAAQTLPLETPMRPLLLLVALIVASGSLVIQGLTLPLVVRLVKPLMALDAEDADERRRVISVMRSAVKETALADALRDVADQGTHGMTRSFSTVGRALAEISGASDTQTALKVRDVLTARGAQAVPDQQEAPEQQETPYSQDVGTEQLEQGAQSTSAQQDGQSAPDQQGTENPHHLSHAQLRCLAIEAIHAQREALLEARNDGVFSSATLQYALDRLDAEEVMLSAHA